MRPALSYYLGGDPVSLWANAVRANGGSVSGGRIRLIWALVAASKACGHWDATDDIALLTAENEPQARTTLKRRVLMTAVNGPTFTADRGYAFDGISQYISTNFVPSTMSGAMGLGNIRVAVYERTNVASNGNLFGASTPITIAVSPRRVDDGVLVQLATSANTTGITGVTDSRGLTAQSRAGGASSVNTWKNGAALAEVSGLTAINTSLPAYAFYIGCRNNAGTASNFRPSTIGACEWGAPLPGGTVAELAWYNALQAHMTAIGANV